MSMPEGTDLTALAMTEGAQVAARGLPVRLADGQVWNLRFGMEALLRLEDAYGSMQGVQDHFDQIMGQDGNPGLLRALSTVLVPGLLEAAEDHDVPESRILRLLDVGRIGDYMQAFQAAISQAFPNAGAVPAASSAGRGKGGPTVAKKGKANRSPGATGSTSPRAGTAARSGSSGA